MALGGNDNWEAGDNRTFTLAASRSDLCRCCYRRLGWAGRRVAVTFQVDMTVHMYVGGVQPGN